MNKIFFVIPVYKVEKYINRCVDSVLAQTYPDTALVLVDDGSPDRSGAICDEYAQKYSNIKVIHKENGGLSDARNAGIMYVREVADENDYITFLDSDDFVHQEYAGKMINLLEKNNCRVVQCGYEKGLGDSFSDCTVAENIQCMRSEDALLGYRLKSAAWAKVYKASVFGDILYPVGMLNEDEFVTYRAVYEAGNIVFTDEKLLYYYRNSSGIMAEVAKKLKGNPHRFDFMEAYKQRIEFFENKNMPQQVMKTKEKICKDIILRYCEQMTLDKKYRDTDCLNGTYIKIYRKNFREMIKRENIPLKWKVIFATFYVTPFLGVIAGKFINMRK